MTLMRKNLPFQQCDQKIFYLKKRGVTNEKTNATKLKAILAQFFFGKQCLTSFFCLNPPSEELAFPIDQYDHALELTRTYS